jgi:outer membrane protein assembly factor BamB
MPSRRAALRALALGATGTLAGCLDGERSGTETDPTSDATGSPTTGETDTTADTPDPPADARWATEVPGTVGELALADGTLYAGTDAGTLVALDAGTGAERWRFDAPTPVWSLGWGTGLLVDDGTLYAVSGSFDGIHGQENAVHALDPATGAERWTYAPDLAYAAFGLHGTSDGALFVGINDDSLSDEGDPTVALEVDTGTERWRVETGDVSGITPSQGTAVVGSQSVFRGLATDDGAERWSVRADEPGLLPPRVADETAYVAASGGSLRALSLDEGTERWTLDAPVNSVLVDGSGGASRSGVFVGGETVRHAGPDGTLRWTAEESLLLALLAGDHVLGFGESAVVSLSPDDGAVAWRAEVGTEYPRPHAVVDGVVVVTDDDSTRLFGLDADSGTRRWTFDPQVPEATAPVVGDGAVFVAESGFIGDEGTSRVVARDLVD